MKQVAIAITTTGPAPKHGARIDELAAVIMEDGRLGKSLCFRIASDQGKASVEERMPFREAYLKLLELAADRPLLVHDAYDLHRFLRAECKRAGIAHTLKRDHPVIDTWALTKERFPGKPHGLHAVANRLDVAAMPDSSGARRDLQLLIGVASKMQPKVEVDQRDRETTQPTPEGPNGNVVVPEARRTLRDRLTELWRGVIGQRT